MRQPRRPRGEVVGRIERRDASVMLPRNPELQPAFDEIDRAALIALRDGNADDNQQRRALGYIMWLTGYSDRLYRPGHNEFVLGRHSVGEAIVAVLASPPKKETA